MHKELRAASNRVIKRMCLRISNRLQRDSRGA